MIKIDPSKIDELTGLLRRREFLDRFNDCLERAKAASPETPLSVALLDVDAFFKVNEQYGHAAGDRMLVAVADAMRGLAGANATLGRYGGDEFTILFDGTEREQAFLTLEQVRQELSRAELSSTNGETIRGIFISGGVASFPVDGRSVSELFRKADHALYRAKSAGRRQIRLAFEERMVPKTTHYTQIQLERLSKLAEERQVSEADLLREAMDDFLTKYGVNDIET
jgi:diguanylate cyclase (GGDEF)-like protein